MEKFVRGEIMDNKSAIIIAIAIIISSVIIGLCILTGLNWVNGAILMS